MGGSTDGGRAQDRTSDRAVTSVGGGSLVAGMLHANQLMTFGCFDEADEAMAEAARHAASDDELAGAAMNRASLRFWHMADLAGSHAVLDEVARVLGDRPASEALVAQRAVLELFTGRTARALARSRAALRRGRGSDAALSLCNTMAVLARGLRGDVDDLAFDEAPAAGDQTATMAYGFRCLAVAFSRTVNGLDVASDAPALPEPIRAVMGLSYEGAAGLADGTRLLWAGRPRSAGVVLEDAVTALRRSDRVRLLSCVLGQLAYARALHGDADGAARAAEDASAARHALSRLDELFVGRGRAWAAAVRGELSTAREHLVPVALSCERLGQPAFAAQAWYDVARLGDATRAAPRLCHLAERAGSDAVVRHLASHVAALAVGDANGIAAAAGWFRSRGHLLHAAEAAAQTAALQRRHRSDADRWVVIARALAGGCEGARTPALAPLADLDLTRREREIVGLVARGLSNRDIATRLNLSVRTVANHLQSSYGKLGIHGRDELLARGVLASE